MTDRCAYPFTAIVGQEELKGKIMLVRQLLPKVTLADDALLQVARMAIAIGVDGHRADIALVKTAMAIAAFAGRTRVTTTDLK